MLFLRWWVAALLFVVVILGHRFLSIDPALCIAWFLLSVGIIVCINANVLKVRASQPYNPIPIAVARYRAIALIAGLLTLLAVLAFVSQSSKNPAQANLQIDPTFTSLLKQYLAHIDARGGIGETQPHTDKQPQSPAIASPTGKAESSEPKGGNSSAALPSEVVNNIDRILEQEKANYLALQDILATKKSTDFPWPTVGYVIAFLGVGLLIWHAIGKKAPAGAAIATVFGGLALALVKAKPGLFPHPDKAGYSLLYLTLVAGLNITGIAFLYMGLRREDSSSVMLKPNGSNISGGSGQSIDRKAIGASLIVLGIAVFLVGAPQTPPPEQKDGKTDTPKATSDLSQPIESPVATPSPTEKSGPILPHMAVERSLRDEPLVVVTFSPGSDKPNQSELNQLKKSLESDNHSKTDILVLIGSTDCTPVDIGRWSSNEHLALARAKAVQEALKGLETRVAAAKQQQQCSQDNIARSVTSVLISGNAQKDN